MAVRRLRLPNPYTIDYLTYCLEKRFNKIIVQIWIPRKGRKYVGSFGTPQEARKRRDEELLASIKDARAVFPWLR